MVLQLVPRIWQRRMVPSQYIWVNFKTAASSGSVLGGSEDNISTTDMVGPPDPVSNIRPLRLREPASEAEREVQELKQRMWSMKHVFWRQHNTHFKQEKVDFAEGVLQKKRVSGELTDCDDVSQITSEELSVFYKDFLDKKYHDQMTFTRNWMKLNLLLTWTEFKYNTRTFFRLNR